MAKPNALQAVLDRAKASAEPLSPAIDRAQVPTGAKPSGTRRGTKLIGGHFSPEISTQLRILAAEGETTVQSLLAEALDDLFVKKGKSRIARN